MDFKVGKLTKSISSPEDVFGIFLKIFILAVPLLERRFNPSSVLTYGQVFVSPILSMDRGVQNVFTLMPLEEVNFYLSLSWQIVYWVIALFILINHEVAKLRIGAASLGVWLMVGMLGSSLLYSNSMLLLSLILVMYGLGGAYAESLIRMQLSVVYIGTVYTKLSESAWIDGTFIPLFMRALKTNWPSLFKIYLGLSESVNINLFLAWAVLLLELFIGVAVLFRSWRINLLVLGVAMSFHALLSFMAFYTFGVFYISIMATTMFLYLCSVNRNHVSEMTSRLFIFLVLLCLLQTRYLLNIKYLIPFVSVLMVVCGAYFSVRSLQSRKI